MYKRQIIIKVRKTSEKPETVTITSSKSNSDFGELTSLTVPYDLIVACLLYTSMQQLHEKIADMNSRYYDLRGKIVKAERRITTPVSYTHLDVYKRQIWRSKIGSLIVT